MPNDMGYSGPRLDLGLGKLVEWLMTSCPKLIAVDTETVSIQDKSIIGLTIATAPDESFWFDVEGRMFPLAIEILKRKDITKVFHNAKFDYEVFRENDLPVDESNFEDSEVLAYTLNLPLKLYNLATALGKQVPEKFMNFSLPKGVTMEDIDYHFVEEKCLLDSQLTLYCWLTLLPQKTRSYEIDRNIIHQLRHMERIGVKLDGSSVADFYDSLKADTEYLRQMIQTQGCDPNSNVQVGTALAQRGIRLPYTKGGKDGQHKQLKVDETTLKEAAWDDALAQSVLVYREKAKLLTYMETVLGHDRVYTSYNNTRVITGRLSSSKPQDYDGPKAMWNMQNVPELLRSVVMADDYFYSYDASQIELRVIAWQSRDKNMMETYLAGGDIHAATMQRLGLKDRRLGKVCNFATVYGGDPEVIKIQGLKYDVKLTMAECVDFQQRMRYAYPQLWEYIEAMRQQIIKHQYVTTMFGRIRRADPIDMGDQRRMEKVMRELINMPTQGSAVEIVKVAMHRARAYDLRIQVHDELVFDGGCPPPNWADGIVEFPTPMELKIGEKWGKDMVKVKVK